MYFNFYFYTLLYLYLRYGPHKSSRFFKHATVQR